MALPAAPHENVQASVQKLVREKKARRVLPKSEIVEQFRIDLDYWFYRYQSFYSRSNAALSHYRFAHVALTTRVFNEMKTVFGNDIAAIRSVSADLRDLIEDRRGVIGENNACLNGVADSHAESSARIGATIQECASVANTTMSGLLTNVFYPAFSNIQQLISTVPTAVIDVLSRGNVLEDEQAIIEYLRAGYSVIDFQWLTATSQLLRWETNRFEVDGMFLVDEMRICMAMGALDFITEISALDTQAVACV